MPATNFRLTLVSLMLFAASLTRSAEAPREPERTIIYPHGALTRLERIGNDLYVFSGWTRGYGIMVFDVSDPTKPALKSGIALPGYVNNPLRQGGTMYVPSLFGLLVLDVSDGRLVLERNLLLDFAPKSGPGRSVFVAGDKLLVVGNATKRLFDISTPSAPLLERYAFAPDIKSIFSDGARFYSFNGAVLSVLSKEGELTEIATLATPIKSVMAIGDAANRKLLVQDRKNLLTLYALAGDTLTEQAKEENVLELRQTSGGIFMKTADTLRLLDDPAGGTLKVAQEFAGPKDPWSQFEFDGKHFYFMAADYNRTLSIFDAASPELRLRATIPICRSDGGLAVADETIYLGSGNMLLAFDKRNPGMNRLADGRLDVSFAVNPNPQAGGKKSFGAYNLLSPSGIRRFGNYLLFSGALIDIRKPLQPAFVGILTAPHLGVAVDGNHAAFAQGDQITIADLSGLPEFKTLGTYASQTNQGPFLDVHLSGNRLYAIDPGHFYVFDAADPTQIKLLDVHAADSPCALAASGEVLYVPSGVSGTRNTVLAYDARNGSATQIEGLVRHGVSTLLVDGPRLFLADGISIVQYDLADPLKPARVAEYTSSVAGAPPDQRSSYTALQVVGDQLYGRKYSRVNTWTIAK